MQISVQVQPIILLLFLTVFFALTLLVRLRFRFCLHERNSGFRKTQQMKPDVLERAV